MSAIMRTLTTITAVLALALVMFVGVPVNAYAAEQVSDTQTEQTEAIDDDSSSSDSGSSKKTAESTKAATPKTGDTVAYVIPLCTAAAAAIGVGIALRSRSRKE